MWCVMMQPTRWLPWLSLAFVIAACDHESEPGPTPCTTSDECWDSREVREVGRCAPKNVYCLDNTCVAECAEICETVSPELNACADERLICNEATSGDDELAFCTGAKIGCESADDCPLYRPASDGSWTCDANVCRFPGFHYADE